MRSSATAKDCGTPNLVFILERFGESGLQKVSSVAGFNCS